MSPPKRQHEALADLGPTTLNGVDQLWKFQIRKENQEILERVEAIAKAGQALPDQLDKRFNDRADVIEALVAKVAKIENELKQIKDEREGWSNEIAGLKEQIQIFLQLYPPDGEFGVLPVA
jgi:chromosome segregation ATPase